MARKHARKQPVKQPVKRPLKRPVKRPVKQGVKQAVKQPPAKAAPLSASPAAKVVRTVAAPSRPMAAAGANRWALVTARDLMRTDVVTVTYSAPLSEVERVLSDNRISGAPVVDEVGRIIGVVSVRDLIDKYASDPDARPRRGQGFFELSTEELEDEDYDAFEVPAESEDTARDVMTGQIHTVPGAAGLKEIAEAMCKHKVHRVLVEDDGRLLGLISTLDILEALRA